MEPGRPDDLFHGVRSGRALRHRERARFRGDGAGGRALRRSAPPVHSPRVRHGRTALLLHNRHPGERRLGNGARSSLMGAHALCLETIAFCQIRIHICTFVIAGSSQSSLSLSAPVTTINLGRVPTCESPESHLTVKSGPISLCRSLSD